MIANYMQAVAIKPPDLTNYIDYIQSSGTQYIDTGFNANQNTRVVMDVEVHSQSNSMACIVGGRSRAATNDSLSFIFWSSNKGAAIRSDFMGNNVSASIALLGRRVIIDKNRNVCHIDDEIVTNSQGTGQALGSLYLFACHDAQSTSINSTLNASVKLYSCQIYDNDVLVRDYVPVLDPYGVACLYDKVSEEYAYNAGSGSFATP